MHNHLYLYPNLKTVRKSKFSQKELAELIGISQQEISRYECGETKAPVNFIKDVADICGVSTDYIFGRSRSTADMLSEEEFEMLELFSKLSEENKIKINPFAQAPNPGAFFMLKFPQEMQGNRRS